MTLSVVQRACAGLVALLLSATSWATTTASGEEPEAGATAPLHQLRIYELVDDKREHFHARFRDHALRIMRRHGFDVVATWESRTAQRTEFVYLLRWPDRDTMQARWTAFMADEEWARIKRHTRERSGVLMGGIEDRVLEATEYSPQVRADEQAERIAG